MCGILYSQDATSFSDLTFLKQRGPEGFQQQNHQLGYFAHSLLNTIGEKVEQPLHNTHGVLLYNGSTYNSQNQNDTQWLAQQLDEKLEHNIDVIKSLVGEFALVYVTESHIIFGVDEFAQRNLWFYYDQNSKQFTACSLPNIIEQKHNHCVRALGNRIYVIDRQSFALSFYEKKTWNLTQTVNNFDAVFETFEQSVQRRYDPKIAINLISSGFDSGVINCATNKLFGEAECVGDPAKENIDILKQRSDYHLNCSIAPNYEGTHQERRIIFNEIIPSNDLWDNYGVDSFIHLMKNCVVKRQKKVVIVGDGGDELYNDYQDQMHGHMWSKSNGLFPSCLLLIWPWHDTNDRLLKATTRVDIMCGYFGLESRNPLLDVDLVQSWLNTTCNLKNSGYKLWMQLYMDAMRYPYTMKKTHWGENNYKPESWKRTNTKKKINHVA